MPHLNLQSGVPALVGGVQVGGTDFSEFAVAPGLPAGITEYGLGPQSPTAVGILNTPLTPTFGDEGNYFEMTGQGDGGFSRWGFGIDAFDGIMEFGELLCRFYYNTAGVKNRNNVGACMSLRGFDGDPIGGADINWMGGTVFDPAVSPLHSAATVSIPAGVTLSSQADIQEAEQDPEWMWLRIRRTQNAGAPGDDDVQHTAWYGDISDEPASVDASAVPSSFAGPRGLFALGWSAQPFFSIFDQRIAFLSYSENPDVEPPPLPSDFGVASVWVPSGLPTGTVWTAPGAGSGQPFFKNGVQVGFTDFSEFAVAPGVPAGITEYGITPTSPSNIDIALDPVEGNFFAMFAQGFKSWGFGLDAFDGLMLTGELLARVFLDIPVNGRKLLGPAANMSGLIGQDEGGADFDNWSGGFFRLDPDELSGVFSTNNGSSSNVITVDTQEPWQDDSWAWVRVRRLLNAAEPATQDDWTITAWFGDLEDEPSSPDGVNIGQVRGQTFLPGAIGWAMPGNAGAETPQGIAFLSFSADPILAAPPVPGEKPATTWTPN